MEHYNPYRFLMLSSAIVLWHSAEGFLLVALKLHGGPKVSALVGGKSLW